MTVNIKALAKIFDELTKKKSKEVQIRKIKNCAKNEKSDKIKLLYKLLFKNLR